jgi:hypothetical protein
MANHPEVIRRQMEETRSQLVEKLEDLENKVSDTVQTTTNVVGETVEAVKDTVENVTATVKETMQTVSQTFDLRLQTERHPWIVFGASVAVGCLAAQLVGARAGRGRQGPDHGETLQDSRSQDYVTEGKGQMDFPPPPKTQNESASTGTRSWFWEELGRFKGLALGAVMGVIRDLARSSITGTIGERVAKEVDHLTTNLGGEPIQGPVLPTE